MSTSESEQLETTSAPVPSQFTERRALELIRERLAEDDAAQHLPMNIQADLTQILDEVLDNPQPETGHTAPTGEYHEGLEEGITLIQRRLRQLLRTGARMDLNPTRIVNAEALNEMAWWQSYVHQLDRSWRAGLTEILAPEGTASGAEQAQLPVHEQRGAACAMGQDPRIPLAVEEAIEADFPVDEPSVYIPLGGHTDGYWDFVAIDHVADVARKYTLDPDGSLTSGGLTD